MSGKVKSENAAIFADEVMVSFSVKTGKDGSRKDPVVRLGFVDAMKKMVVAEVVVTPTTAHALAHIIEGTLKKIEETKSGKTTKREEGTSYIG